MTHLTSTCRTRGRAGPVWTWPHFLRCGGARVPGGPRPAPRRPLAGSPGPEPTPTRGLAAAGPALQQRTPRAPATLGEPPSPRDLPHNAARTLRAGGEDVRAASPPPGPQEETPGLSPAAEGAGPAYRRRRQRPLAAGAPTCGAEEPARLWQVERAAAAAQSEPGPRKKRRARAGAAAAPGGGAGP